MYCTFCGKEISKDAVICTGCGRFVQKQEAPAPTPTIPTYNARLLSIIFGIVGILFSWHLPYIATYAYSAALIFGIIDYKESKNVAGIVLGIIGKVISIVYGIVTIMWTIAEVIAVYQELFYGYMY